MPSRSTRQPVAIVRALSRSPKPLPPIEYPAGLEVRKVQSGGRLSYHGREFRVSMALRGLPVALRPVPEADSRREVLFCHQVITRIDLQQPDVID